MIADVWCPWCRDHQRAELAAESDAQRTRAEAAVAEVARLRAAHERLTRAIADRKGALESVAPERVRAYLAAHGWTMRRALVMGDFPVELWAHPRREREAVVLTTTEPGDYAARMWDVAAWCSVVEARDPAFVLADWLTPLPDALDAADAFLRTHATTATKGP